MKASLKREVAVAAFLVIVTIVLFLMAPCTGEARIYKVSYTEPTTNSNGSALTDLLHCTLYYQIPLGNQTKAWDNTATAPTGGGNIVDKLAPITVPVVDEEKVDFWMTCTDTVLNESAPTVKVKANLPTASPIGVIVK